MQKYQMPPLLCQQDELTTNIRAKLIARGCPNNLKTAKEAEVVARNLKILAAKN